MSRHVQGVMLTHANLLSVVAGQLGAINQVGGRYGQTFTQEDVMISYLPLAHIFDRCALVLLQLDAVQITNGLARAFQPCTPASDEAQCLYGALTTQVHSTREEQESKKSLLIGV